MNKDVSLHDSQFGKGKKIILVMPTLFGFSDLMVQNLEKYGFEVLFFTLEPYQYKSVRERLNNFYRKTVLGDKRYKERLSQENMLQKVIEQTHNGKIVDYALFIRADSYPRSTIELVKSKAKCLIGYQWDGIDNYPNIFKSMDLFDKFFVFDPKDIINHPTYNFQLTHNFYFDGEEKNEKPYSITPPSLYFVSSHSEDKLSAINTFLAVAKKLNLSSNFLIANAKTSKRQNSYIQYPLTFLLEPITYQQNLDYVNQADVLIDFVFSGHTGLSLRFFEAMYYQKKIITNNPEIQHYDFYREHNIFIWDGVNINEKQLNDFLATPYEQLPQDIVKKYAFGHWIHEILA